MLYNVSVCVLVMVCPSYISDSFCFVFVVGLNFLYSNVEPVESAVCQKL